MTGTNLGQKSKKRYWYECQNRNCNNVQPHYRYEFFKESIPRCAVCGTALDVNAKRKRKDVVNPKGCLGVYFLYLITDGEFYKIGIAKAPIKRLAELQIGNARELHLLDTAGLSSTAAPSTRIESKCHRQLIDRRVRGEWFANLPSHNLRQLFDFLPE